MSGFGGVTNAVTETVRDVRGLKQTLSLEENGFMYWDKPLKYSGPINNYEQVKAEYWPEVEELVKEAWCVEEQCSAFPYPIWLRTQH